MIHKEIEQTFNKKLLTLDANDLTFKARKYSIDIERAENLDVLESMNEHKQKRIKNANFWVSIKRLKKQ